MRSKEHAARRTQKISRLFPLNMAFVFTFFIMFGIWLILSGRFDGFHILLGLFSSLIVARVSSDFLLPGLTAQQAWRLPGIWFRFICYIPWLLYQVLIANLHVLYLALHPRMMTLIDPQIVEFKTKLNSNLAQITLANSITLTPGTITVSLSVMGDVTVHAIDRRSAQGLPGDMASRITEVFKE